MKKPIVKLLLILTLFAFFYNSAYSYSWKTRKIKDKYRFHDIQQVSFETSRKSFIQIDKSVQQSNFFTTSTPTSNFNTNYSNQDYYYRTPFQEVSSYSTTQNYSNIEPPKSIMRASNNTNDDEFPGDPGQFPIGDGGYIIALALAVYTFFKFRLTFKK